MKTILLSIIIVSSTLSLAGCNDKEGVTFVKDPANAGQSLTPPGWAAVARSEIQTGLTMSLFSASCHLLYWDAHWFVGCKPAEADTPFMLYAIQRNSTLHESFTATAINDNAKQSTRQNLLLRQIGTADDKYAALFLERLKQNFDAQTGS